MDQLMNAILTSHKVHTAPGLGGYISIRTEYMAIWEGLVLHGMMAEISKLLAMIVA